MRIRWTQGADSVVLKKVQLNGGGFVQAVAEPDATIDRTHPMVEVPLAVKPSEKLLGDIYLHLVLEQPKPRSDSYALVELIK